MKLRVVTLQAANTSYVTKHYTLQLVGVETAAVVVATMIWIKVAVWFVE
jgi:hypothetical protein